MKYNCWMLTKHKQVGNTNKQKKQKKKEERKKEPISLYEPAIRRPMAITFFDVVKG